MAADMTWFKEARYGLFIHYGLYSMLGRGEWVLNRERIPIAEYKKLADRFTAEKLDFDWLLKRAKQRWGMNYAILTCKHHDGFCLYDSSHTDFNSVKTHCGRDLVAEFVAACRKHGLRIALYHSLNDWTTSPDAVDALERPAESHQPFIDFVHRQIHDLMTKYGKIDVMWYDGWWPFDGAGWQAEKLNAMVRQLQPGILINSRCGLRGDFDTPENHITASSGAWEACMTLNDNWGYHQGDTNWKSPKEVAEMLRQCAAGCGNLIINVGPRGDGSVPEDSMKCLDRAGEWLAANRESIFDTQRFVFGMHVRQPGEQADWTSHGKFTARENAFYWHIRHWPGTPLTIAGVESKVTAVEELATGKAYPFRHENGILTITGPANADTSMPVVLRCRTEGWPSLYRSGGYRDPRVTHPHYDPVASDLIMNP